MQPMWICLLSCRWFVKTHEKSKTRIAPYSRSPSAAAPTIPAALPSLSPSLLNFDSSDSIYLPAPRLESLCLPTTDEVQNPYLKFVINKSSHCLCYNLNQPKFTNREAVKIKASEMLVAPRISVYFLKFRNLEIWKFENLENLENLGTFGKKI